jgi:hypothetical protein
VRSDEVQLCRKLEDQSPRHDCGRSAGSDKARRWESWDLAKTSDDIPSARLRIPASSARRRRSSLTGSPPADGQLGSHPEKNSCPHRRQTRLHLPRPPSWPTPVLIGPTRHLRAPIPPLAFLTSARQREVMPAWSTTCRDSLTMASCPGRARSPRPLDHTLTDVSSGSCRPESLAGFHSNPGPPRSCWRGRPGIRGLPPIPSPAFAGPEIGSAVLRRPQ